MIEKHLKEKGFKGIITREKDLGKITAYKTGGKADFLVEPFDIHSLEIFIKFLNKENKTFFVIGGGTNVLIKNTGISYALSLKKGFNDFKTESEENNSIDIRISAGTSLSRLCWFCAKNGFAGLNPLIGIPGSVGGAVFMNAGTPAGSIGDVIKEVTIIDEKGISFRLDKGEIEFLYRSLSIKKRVVNKFIITEVLINLGKSDPFSVYQEAKHIIINRKKTQPVKALSCGCFFKNPDNEMPAGMLIEKAGLKGRKIGGAMVSTVHANFITNSCNASYEDIISLKKLIQSEVKKRFNIELEPEVKIVGR